MVKKDNTIKKSINVLLHYEQGKINLKQAVDQLTSLSGLSEEVAETFIKSLNRANVVQLKDKQ
jgi:hypothetical protein